MTPTTVVDRVAAAPISWGVCEVPGWGLQLPADRVLAEMQGLGVTATELGPAGYLPTAPAELRALLERHRLRLVAAFVPVVLHDPECRQQQLEQVRRAARQLADAGGEVLVLAASTGRDDYSASTEPTHDEWIAFAAATAACQAIAAEAGLVPALHPHVGTVVERAAAVDAVLELTDIGLCVDTGHLLAGGVDPLALVRRVPERVRHVHLKDVDAALAEQVRAGELSYDDAVRRGLYRPLGDGDVPVAEVVTTLENAGYRGWYVLEQDCMLDAEPEAGGGPLRDVRRSLEFLRGVTGG